MSSKQANSLQELFTDVKKILELIEIKDQKAANSYETDEIRDDADIWMNSRLGKDTYLMYRRFWNEAMFKEVDNSLSSLTISKWISEPFSVPLRFHDNLLDKGRKAFLEQYTERNEYYLMLNGQPPAGTPSSEFVYLSDELKERLHAPDVPVHELSDILQNAYISTNEYQEILTKYPEKRYLKYLGSYKVDILSARLAKDFDIIRYPAERPDINPNILSTFPILYKNYREYVMVVLYNEYLEDVYPGYRSFIGLIIKSFVLCQISNKALEAMNSMNFMDDSALYMLTSLYDIPDSLVMTNNVRRSLATNLLKLVREKGTDEIYYDLVKILGYQDIIISRLMLMKGQQFDSDNNYQASNNSEPYFVKIDINDDKPYETIASGKASQYSYHDIVDGDPTWWDLPDTRGVLMDSNYTMSDSKYITIEAVIHQMQYMFEVVYFSKLILDNKSYTDAMLIEVPELFGTEPISMYDLMIYIIAAICMNNGMNGDITTDESKLLAVAGFNFEFDPDLFMEFLDTTTYVEKEKLESFIKNISIHDISDISRVFNDIIYPMHEWLILKISRATNRHEFLEYESIYRALYTYDINHNTILQDIQYPMDIIKEQYGITDEDIKAFQHFYPHTISGEAISIDDYDDTSYTDPFISEKNQIEWYIHIVLETPYGEEDRGFLYFYDILNCSDIRELTNSDGTRVFMDYEDNEVGWEVNKKAVDKAIYLIGLLDEKALESAFFQIKTPILNSGGLFYDKDELLPSNIRTGIYRDILKDKISMDIEGFAKPPKTYLEYLYRKNRKLYNLLTVNDRFHLDKDGWLNDVMKVVLAIETNLGVHVKYFEQAAVGQNLFFKPLLTLINHFKSALVTVARTSLSYVFGDKVDIGGNSNMFSLFDEVNFVIHFVTLASTGYESSFGLYDTINKLTHHLFLTDRTEIISSTPSGYENNQQQKILHSLSFHDTMQIYKNNIAIDEAVPIADDELNIQLSKKSWVADIESWKKYLESYNVDNE